MKGRPLYSQTIDFLRFPLAIMVILLHNNPLGIQLSLSDNNMSLYHQFPLYFSIHHLFTNDVTRIAVPLFFFISGYLFFLKYRESKEPISIGNYYQGKIKGAFHSIVVPFFLWNIIYILLNFCIQTFFSAYMKGSQMHYVDYGWQEWLHYFLFPGHLWFLRDLFVVSVCSILLFYALKNKILGIVFLIASFLGWFWGCPDIFGVVTIDSFLFWSIGAWCCLNNIDFTGLKKYVVPLGCIYMVLLVFDITLWRMDNSFFIYFERLAICLGLMFTISFTAKLLSKKDISIDPVLPKSSYFIYLSHCLLLLVVLRLYMMFVPSNEILLMVEYFVVPPVVAVFLVWAYKLMASFTPSLLKLLNGGRI